MKPGADLRDEIPRLEGLTIFELRGEWRRHLRMAPPMRLSRDLLVRGIAYRLQEKALGKLSKACLRRLSVAPTGPGERASTKTRTAVLLKPGTRLVREWHGVTHSVLVHADGFEWQGRRHRSLSVIAGAITGAHWSGPRFFGLTRSAVDGAAQVERRSANKGIDGHEGA
ncbi:DUF2924 domain-containing protein [Aurantimonas sp. C2-6-R+9]|uniref:DUF2924 domain-containing protein n=1 Tax=unclassified Aurantimonas TaxID=2638230 RepID=UPI002E17C0F1|nr:MULTISPECIES: DUF2924 domain-containing protein [unclassified Aurantimonas]MEC5292301.1 DUF2924 domain-containing protein [Aurantimonas sp. C2-3-R2]MEC5382594.1 DUF2924 domain-containing protein [Aurantimonas sp. C2-6-R+9]MEC5413386.1 DUF2924 domain-containing protein [Aurantimonas sp. C2-4-R8]